MIGITFVLGGCDGADPPERHARALAVIGGTDSTIGSVVTIGPLSCGATLVAPNLLLTAKHCVARLFPGPYECGEDGEVLQIDPNVTYPEAGRYGPVSAPGQITVGRSGSPYAPRVVEVRVSPDDVICTGDAALLVLDRDVDDPVIAPLRLDVAPVVGEALLAVGYGGTLTSEGSLVLQERAVTVAVVGPAAAEPGVAGPVNAGFFSTGEALCRGDSGSAAFASSGAVVGIASGGSRIDVDALTGTTADCVSPLLRSHFQGVAPIAAFIQAGFAAAGAVPWLEGEPDPRAELGGDGATCATDGDCRSNVCVEDGDGVRSCSHGCLEAACADGYVCELITERMRCVPEPATPDEPAAPTESDDDGGCRIAAGGPETGLSIALLLAFAAIGLRRQGGGSRRIRT
ncbi:MAG: S1 family peptidase [Nannocystis sp.]|nr:S1 family peptidase [Nannocystis sp.]MBA3549762.1 S1 family peptidase [Nannocystis sp.]